MSNKSHKNLEDKRCVAKRKFDRLAQKKDPTPEDLQRQIDVAGELALLHAKTLTVAQAEQWADEFISERPSKERFYWAGEFVGSVKTHQENRRGPPPDSKRQAPSDVYDPIVRSARKLLGHVGFDISSEELSELKLRVDQLCGLLPPLSTHELRLILRRLKEEMGR
jgi:hypothetical protein